MKINFRKNFWEIFLVILSTLLIPLAIKKCNDDKAKLSNVTIPTDTASKPRDTSHVNNDSTPPKKPNPGSGDNLNPKIPNTDAETGKKDITAKKPDTVFTPPVIKPIIKDFAYSVSNPDGLELSDFICNGNTADGSVSVSFMITNNGNPMKFKLVNNYFHKFQSEAVAGGSIYDLKTISTGGHTRESTSYAKAVDFLPQDKLKIVITYGQIPMDIAKLDHITVVAMSQLSGPSYSSPGLILIKSLPISWR